MDELTLYYAVPSRGMVIHWMLEELGVPYHREILSLEDEEHKRPDFLAMNRMGRVPVLRHGDKVVTETAAIVMYLAETFSPASLNIEPGHPERAAFLRWMFFAPVSAEPAVLWESLGKITTERDYVPFSDVETVAKTIEEAITGKQYLVGGRFTAADVMLGTTIMWGTQLMPVLPNLPAMSAYWDRLSERPAWQRSFARDQELMG